MIWSRNYCSKRSWTYPRVCLDLSRCKSSSREK